MHEILQSFRGANYVTSLDLRQVFLQIMLAKSSRKYTAFQFESKVCQFTRIPYGMRNKLSGLIIHYLDLLYTVWTYYTLSGLIIRCLDLLRVVWTYYILSGLIIRCLDLLYISGLIIRCLDLLWHYIRCWEQTVVNILK
jgi:hypothetical protein